MVKKGIHGNLERVDRGFFRYDLGITLPITF